MQIVLDVFTRVLISATTQQDWKECNFVRSIGKLYEKLQQSVYSCEGDHS